MAGVGGGGGGGGPPSPGGYAVSPFLKMGDAFFREDHTRWRGYGLALGTFIRNSLCALSIFSAVARVPNPLTRLAKWERLSNLEEAGWRAGGTGSGDGADE